MDTRHNDLTGASIPPFAGGMDDDPVPDPPTLSAVRPLRGRQLRRCLDTGSIRWLPRHRCRPPPGWQRSVS